MRLMKMFCLAAIATVAALTFVGASTASAEGVAVCQENALPCPESKLVSLIHFALKAGTVGRLLSSIATLLCLEILVEKHIEGSLWNPFSLSLITLFKIAGCGSNAAHNNCSSIKAVGEDGLATLTKTAANLGVIKGTAAKPGSVNVQCTIIGFPVNCDYSGQNLTFPVEGSGHTAGAGNGRLTANETPVELTTTLGGFFCPSNSKLDAELISLTPIFITG